jgi:hypothetical protein
MFDLNSRKSRKTPLFTLDRVELERAKGQGRMKGRRALHLIIMLAVAVGCGYGLWSFVENLKKSATPYANQLHAELALKPMARPTLDGVGALPDAAALAEQAETVKEQLAKRSVPLQVWIDQPDASAFAWAQAVLAEDLRSPPVPQRLVARDLVTGHARIGAPAVVSGILEDAQTATVAGGDREWQRLLIELEPQQHAEILVPVDASTDLAIGQEVQVLGRYLGAAHLPGAAAGQPAVEVPLFIARAAARPKAEAAVESAYRMTQDWRLPDDTYQDVDDNLLVIETRPYYNTIGTVLRDIADGNVYANAPSANAKGSDIHGDPKAFRGQPFTIKGHVFHAWEDEGVAKDHPFGVPRVVRAILWNEDYGPYEQIGQNGKKAVLNKLVLRAFEIAAISDKPLPQPGEVITASGRFLRMRAIEVESNFKRDLANDVMRQSDRAYTFLFVTAGWQGLPPPAEYDLKWLNFVVFTIAIGMAALLITIARKESRKEATVQESVRKMREARKGLKGKGKGEAAADAADGAVAEAPGSPAAPAPEPDAVQPSGPGDPAV